MWKIRDWLYIGDAEDAARAGETDAVSAVVSLHGEEVDSWKPYDADSRAYAAEMLDSTENTQEAFNTAVETVFTALEEHGEVLVHCSAGVSRSASIVATVLAEKEDKSFEDALAEVRAVKSNVKPHLTLEKQAYEYLGQEHPFAKYENSE